ncbi:hypothetical protein J2S07_004349 [Robertmurraya andreesenii]|uniref:Uncharacterized protein n=1 Tax=Anoxybacillus andreesenii TaxID=1325932 RepID=A0ABT9VAI2_9BACL|nr:hypothetical protein [Robertmurraya andreesenii]
MLARKENWINSLNSWEFPSEGFDPYPKRLFIFGGLLSPFAPQKNSSVPFTFIIRLFSHGLWFWNVLNTGHSVSY